MRASGRRGRLLLALLLLVLGFVGTVVALNATLYSAGGFVTAYLQSLARHDAAGALATAGVEVPDGLDRSLLVPAAIAAPTDIRIVSVEDSPDGTRTVTAAYRLTEGEGSTRFVVEPVPPRFGLFMAWRFVESPVAALDLTVSGADEVRANDAEVPADGGDTADRALLVPGAVTLDHESALLEADAVVATATEAGAVVPAGLDVRATEGFVALVQREIDDYLAEDCATQRVLQPTGCPFGQTFGDRIDGAPTWTIAQSPPVTLVPGERAGEWLMPTTPGAAHLEVDVVSIFDGSVSRFDEDVPFTLSFRVTIGDEGAVAIEAIPPTP